MDWAAGQRPGRPMLEKAGDGRCAPCVAKAHVGTRGLAWGCPGGPANPAQAVSVRVRGKEGHAVDMITMRQGESA